MLSSTDSANYILTQLIQMQPKKPVLKQAKEQNDMETSKQLSSQQGQSMSSLPGPSLRDAVRKVSNAGIFRR